MDGSALFDTNWFENILPVRHMKPLGMPDMRLQPHAPLPLSPVVLLQQVCRSSPVPPAWPLRFFIGRVLALRFFPRMESTINYAHKCLSF